jgi:hypothetical protein
MVIRDAIVLDPDVRVVQPVGKAAYVSLPVADEEVKVVRAIALRQVRRILGGLGKKREGEGSVRNQQGEDCLSFHSIRPFQMVRCAEETFVSRCPILTWWP